MTQYALIKTQQNTLKRKVNIRSEANNYNSVFEG